MDRHIDAECSADGDWRAGQIETRLPRGFAGEFMENWRVEPIRFVVNARLEELAGAIDREKQVALDQEEIERARSGGRCIRSGAPRVAGE